MAAIWDTRLAPSKRGEFETVEDFQKRAAPIDPHELFRFSTIVDRSTSDIGTDDRFAIRYDIDIQELRVRIQSSRNNALASPLRGHTIQIEDKTTGGAKTGQNAFGVEASYLESKGTKYFVVVRNLREFAAHNALLLTDRPYPPGDELSLKLHMDATKAARLKRDLQVRIGLSFVGREHTQTFYLTKIPTINDPFGLDVDQHYAEANLRELVLVDAQSGEVLAAYASPGPN